jgi:mannose-6-phosphate isomerase-like protein (cupin superfamily)
MAGSVVVRERGEGTPLWMLGGLYEVKASADETGGAVTVMEMTVPEGMGPPPHVHDCDETAYVIEGRARYHIDGRTVEVGPGTLLHFPKGTEETFEPIGQLRILLMYAPGGMDKFFAEAGEPAASREVPPPPGPPDVERLVAVGAKHGLELRAP